MATKRKSTARIPEWRPPDSRPPILPGAEAGRVEDIEQLLGPGDDLWADDAEFEAFLAALRRWRQEDRDASRRP
jgi:hypothetical protein